MLNYLLFLVSGTLRDNKEQSQTNNSQTNKQDAAENKTAPISETSSITSSRLANENEMDSLEKSKDLANKSQRQLAQLQQIPEDLPVSDVEQSSTQNVSDVDKKVFYIFLIIC